VQSWTEQEFEELCWHDCHVHAWGITKAAHGQATLTLDIDFITAWEQPGDGAFAFQVAPATLVFFDVFAFAFSLDYTGFAVGPFSIRGIERDLRVNAAGFQDYLYRIEIDYPPGGLIQFSGDRFRQVLRAPPARSSSQSLDPGVRVPLLGGA
jgi:hypothetical protein